jgi:hypothetical protein
MAKRSKAWAVFALSNTGVVGLNPTRGIDFCVRWICVKVLALQRADPPSEESYRLCIGLINWKREKDPKGCRATERERSAVCKIAARFWTKLTVGLLSYYCRQTLISYSFHDTEILPKSYKYLSEQNLFFSKLFSKPMLYIYLYLFFININLFNCSCNCICISFIVCSVSFIVCVVFVCCVCLSVVCYLCDVCYLCVVSYCSTLPPGKNPFVV